MKKQRKASPREAFIQRKGDAGMKKVRYITDAAMITAVILAILLISEFTGLELEETFFFLIPAPIALYALLHSPQKAIIPAISISLLSMLIHSPIHGLLFIVPSCFTGVLYGFFINKRFPGTLRIVISILGALLINVLTLVVFSDFLFGFTIVDDTRVLVTEALQLLEFANLSTHFKSMAEALMIGLIPALVAVVSILEGVFSHTVTIFLANRIAKNQDIGIFRGLRIEFPRVVTYILIPIIVASFAFLGNYLTITGTAKILLIIGMNISFAALIFYAFEGLTLVAVYLNKKRKTNFFILAVLALIVLFPVMAFLGILDSLFKLKQRVLFLN